jgi:hypothetical protein
MGALFDLADRTNAQLLQGLVVELAAVVVAHARTRPDCYRKVRLLMNGLVSPMRQLAWKSNAHRHYRGQEDQ